MKPVVCSLARVTKCPQTPKDHTQNPGATPGAGVLCDTHTMRRLPIIALATLVLLAACGGPMEGDALTIAERLTKRHDDAAVTEVTADDDPMGMHFNDPDTVAVIYLPGSECFGPSHRCGAAVVVFADDHRYVDKWAWAGQAAADEWTPGVTYWVNGQAILIVDSEQDETTKDSLVKAFGGAVPEQ